MTREDLKAHMLKEYKSGGISMRKLGTKYGYGNGTVSRWVMAEEKEEAKLNKRIAANTAVKGTEAMPAGVKQLQEELRMSRLKVSLLEAMIDISDEQFGTDIRKKAGTRPS